MKKRTRAITGMMLAATCALGTVMSGCGGGGGGGADDDVVKIAVPISLTGESAKAGGELQDAITMAFEEIDYTIGDYTIELDFIDATSDADKGAMALEEGIVKNGDELVLSSWNSSVAVAMVDTVTKYKIPWYFSSSSSSVIDEKVANTEDCYLISKIWPTSESLMIGYFELLQELIDKGEWDPADVNYAIFADDTDFGRAFGSEAKEQMEAFGGECVFEDYTAISVTDFYTSIAKIKEADPDFLLVQLTNPAAAAAFIKQAEESNVSCLMTNDCITEAANWYELTGDSATGTLVCRSKLVNDAAMEFQAAFEEKYGYTPAATTGGINYDGAKFLIKCMEACLEEYGAINSETMYEFGIEVLQKGGITYDESVLVKEYVYDIDGESGINPIVDQDHFYFQVTQFDGDQAVVVWPEQDKEGDMFIPDYVQR